MVNPTRSREQRSNRAYRTTEKVRWDTAEIRFQQDIIRGNWGRTVPVGKNGKALKHIKQKERNR